MQIYYTTPEIAATPDRVDNSVLTATGNTLRLFCLTEQTRFDLDPGGKSLSLLTETVQNRFEFGRDEAEQIGQAIAAQGGYARLLFGGSVFSEYGEDPRHV